MQQIKKNVWKLKNAGTCYSLKRYDSYSTAVKVKSLHETLDSIAFPHLISVLSNTNMVTFIQPWLEGARAVNFKKRADRTDSLEALNRLHETRSLVDWTAYPYLNTYPLITKWSSRIERFREISGVCETFIGKDQVESILYYAENALQIIQREYRDELIETLLHGDVVHHNILRDKGGFIRFIDFDLACTGPAGTEIALWMHRVLPHIEYDIEFLMEEQPSLGDLDYSSKVLLLYPNELLREWLHFFTLSASAQQRQVRKLVPFTDSALSHWPELWYNVERMKK